MQLRLVCFQPRWEAAEFSQFGLGFDGPAEQQQGVGALEPGLDSLPARRGFLQGGAAAVQPPGGAGQAAAAQLAQGS